MSTRLFVGNLPYGASEEDLRTSLASPDITIKSVRLAVDRETGRGRGFGFVEVGTPEEAERAIQEWSGRLVGGRAIAIDRAHERRPGGGGAPPPRRPSGGPGMSPRFNPMPAMPEPDGRPDPREFVAPIDRDEGEGRRRSGGRNQRGPGRKRAGTGREAPKERGGKWRYDPSEDY